MYVKFVFSVLNTRREMREMHPWHLSNNTNREIASEIISPNQKVIIICCIDNNKVIIVVPSN